MIVSHQLRRFCFDCNMSMDSNLVQIEKLRPHLQHLLRQCYGYKWKRKTKSLSANFPESICLLMTRFCGASICPANRGSLETLKLNRIVPSIISCALWRLRLLPCNASRPCAIYKAPVKPYCVLFKIVKLGCLPRPGKQRMYPPWLLTDFSRKLVNLL